jgi:carbon storage regulator
MRDPDGGGIVDMLVLRRKAGEAIVLNGDIIIQVLAVEGERVKLGISAPPEVVIVRSELLEGMGGEPPMSPDAVPPGALPPASSGGRWPSRAPGRAPGRAARGPDGGDDPGRSGPRRGDPRSGRPGASGEHPRREPTSSAPSYIAPRP